MFVIVFALVGNRLFYDIQQYGTFEQSISTLYESALGGFDFSIYKESEKTTEFIGKLFMAVYLLISLIFLLNFLIAILSSSFADLEKKGVGLKMAEIIKLRILYEEHPKYCCLVNSIPLTNIIILILSPIILIAKSPKLNRIILGLEFMCFNIIRKVFVLAVLTIATMPI
jgi:hypothetical protein